MPETDFLQPTDEEALRLAKTLLRTARYGALATLAPETGAPQATRVGVATDFDGAPILLISGLTAHAKALKVDGRCSLLLGPPGKGDPLAHARITIAANAAFIGRDHADHARLYRRYLAHQPKAKLYADLGDFSFVRLEPVSASLNGGFGKAYVLDTAQLLSSAEAELADGEAHAVEHMNEDHFDAIALYARYYCKAENGNWVLTGIDQDGITIALGDDVRRIFFDTPLAKRDDMHIFLVKMAREARVAFMEA